jgi:hypothetical protein
MGQKLNEDGTPIEPETPPAGDPPAAPPEGDGISNQDLKSNPVFQKVTTELAQLRQEKADRDAQEQEAKDAAERKKLEDAGKYEEAIALRDAQLKEQADKHAKDILQRDLKLELINNNFTNKTFIKGAITSFDGEPDTIGDYVKELAALEENKIFINDGKAKRNPLPETPPAGGSVGAMSVEEARIKAKQSEDPKVKAAARKVLAAEFDRLYNEKNGLR